MKRIIFIGAIIFSLVLVVIGCGVSRNDYSKVINERDTAISNLSDTNTQLNEANDKIKSLEDEKSALRAELDTKIIDFNNLSSKIGELNVQINDLNDQINDLNDQIKVISKNNKITDGLGAQLAVWNYLQEKLGKDSIDKLRNNIFEVEAYSYDEGSDFWEPDWPKDGWYVGLDIFVEKSYTQIQSPNPWLNGINVDWFRYIVHSNGTVYFLNGSGDLVYDVNSNLYSDYSFQIRRSADFVK